MFVKPSSCSCPPPAGLDRVDRVSPGSPQSLWHNPLANVGSWKYRTVLQWWTPSLQDRQLHVLHRMLCTDNLLAQPYIRSHTVVNSFTSTSLKAPCHIQLPGNTSEMLKYEDIKEQCSHVHHHPDVESQPAPSCLGRMRMAFACRCPNAGGDVAY